MLTSAGCAALQNLGVPNPSASITGVHIADFSLTDLTLVFDVAIANPYPVPLPLVNVDYALASGGKSFLQGQAPLQGSVPANGSQTVSLPAKVVFFDLLRALQGVRAGSVVPYDGTLGLSVNVPEVGAVRLPLQKSGQVPVPTIPSVSVTQLAWQKVSLAGATGVMNVRIGNNNEFPVDIAGFDYALRLAGFDVASGALANAASLVPGATKDIGISLSISTAQAGLALFQAVQSNAVAYGLGGVISLGTPFGPLRIPVQVGGNAPISR